MKWNRSGFSLFTLACGIVLLASCASGPKSYTIKGEGDALLNRDANGKSLSVVVRVYQLKDAREFSKLTFDSLADGRPDADLLGPALLDKIDVVLIPGGNYASSEKLLEETKYVGIVGFFRHPDPYLWRLLVDADAVRSNGLAFKVQDCYVLLTALKPFQLPGQNPNARPVCRMAGPARRAREGAELKAADAGAAVMSARVASPTASSYALV